MTNPEKLSRELEQLEEHFENEIASTQIRHGMGMLAVYKSILQGRNTKNHRIKIIAGNGTAFIDVINNRTGESQILPDNKERGIFKLLHTIQESLNYDWAWTITDESINQQS